MAIELISTITTKNNGNYAIALSNEIKGGLHSKDTIAERDNIPKERLQEGMLCYVSESKQYYQWGNGTWGSFSGGSGNMYMYRVDTYEDMLEISTTEMKDGTLCHVKDDINENYLYYFNKYSWHTVGSKYQVWIGTQPPLNKNYLWVDTRNMVNGDDVTVDNPPTFIDTPLIQYLKNQITALSQKIHILQNDLEDAIKNGIGSGGGGGSNRPIITEDRFVTEEGDYLLTEDESYFLTEDSGTNTNNGNNNDDDNNNNNNNNNNYDEEIEDEVIPIKGGRVTTTVKEEEILMDDSLLTQVTIFNETNKEIHIIVNLGEIIPLEVDESLSFGDIKIYSIVVVESKSTIKYIGY